jgi:broad specificity phosphatase PhoE
MNESKWPAALTIVRHGQSERNVQKEASKAAGLLHSYVDSVRDQDTLLTVVGKGQALHVGVELREDEAYDVILLSPYTRTRQTTEHICRGMGYYTKLVEDERLREIEFGILDGLTPDGIKAKYPEEIARRKKEGKYWYRAPGGESRPDVALRIQSLLGTIVREYAGKRVLVVTHSVVVLVFRKLLERWNEEDYMKIDKEQDVKNCSITHYISEGDKLILQKYNHVCYPEDK